MSIDFVLAYFKIMDPLVALPEEKSIFVKRPLMFWLRRLMGHESARGGWCCLGFILGMRGPKLL